MIPQVQKNKSLLNSMPIHHKGLLKYAGVFVLLAALVGLLLVLVLASGGEPMVVEVISLGPTGLELEELDGSVDEGDRLNGCLEGSLDVEGTSGDVGVTLSAPSTSEFGDGCCCCCD